MANRYGNDYVLDIPNYQELLRETTHRVMVKDCDRYNCGGFALGLFNWYRPYDYYNDWDDDAQDDDIWDIRNDIANGYDYDDGCTEIARIMVGFMEKEGVCRRIHDSSELRKGEYLVAFKASYDDFHYARRLSNGRWFHKMGWSEIEEVTEKQVYSYEWWNSMACEYAGDLFLLAVPYSNADRVLI